MRALAPIAAAALLAAAAPALAQQEHRDGANGFALTLPAGWTVSTPEPGDASIKVNIDGPRTRCNVAIVESDVVARMSRAELDAAVERGDLKDAMRHDMQDTEELAYAYRTIDQDGGKAAFFDGTYRLDGVTVRTLKVILLGRGRAYNMNCSGLPDEYDKWSAEVNQAMRSFRILR